MHKFVYKINFFTLFHCFSFGIISFRNQNDICLETTPALFYTRHNKNQNRILFKKSIFLFFSLDPSVMHFSQYMAQVAICVACHKCPPMPCTEKSALHWDPGRKKKKNRLLEENSILIFIMSSIKERWCCLKT